MMFDGALLDAQMHAERDPARRVDLLNVWAANLRHTDLEQAWALNHAAEHHAQSDTFASQPYHQGLIDCWYWRGKLHALGNEHEQALACFLSALPLCAHVPPADAAATNMPFSDAPDQFVEQHTSARALHNVLGVTLAELEQFDEALEHYLAAQHQAEMQHDSWLQTLLCNNIGYLYRAWNEPQQALTYLCHGLQRLASFPHSMAWQRLKATLLDNCCWCLGQLGRGRAALACGLHSRQIYQQLEWERGLVEIDNCLGTVYVQLGAYAQAHHYFKQAYQRAHRSQNHGELMIALIQIGRLYWHRTAHLHALQAVGAALRWAETANHRAQQIACHQLLADIHESLDHPRRALQHYKQLHALHQQVFTEQANRRLRVYQIKHQLAEARQAAELHLLRASTLEQEMHERARVQAELEQLAATDTLTGVWNRRAFVAHAERAIHHARVAQQPLALLLLDIDRFKSINDTYGHAIGDQILCAMVLHTQACLRSDDVLARYGGEEFVVALPRTNHAEALRIAERVREAVAREAYQHETQHIAITISIGIATFEDPEDALDQLVQRADRALYTAKRAGRNRVQLYI